MSKFIRNSEIRRILYEKIRSDEDYFVFIRKYFADLFEIIKNDKDRVSCTNLLLKADENLALLRKIISNDEMLRSLKRKYILHLSDLHFVESSHASLSYTQLLLDLKQQLHIEKLSAIVVSGDITNQATKEQFAIAQNFLKKIGSAFNVQTERFVSVPGNHDINWASARASYKEQPETANLEKEIKKGTAYVDSSARKLLREDSQYDKRLELYSKFHQELCGEEYPLDYERQATVQHFKELNILFLGLNSAYYTDHAFPRRAGISTGAFGCALEKVCTNTEYEKCVKIAVWHHPPSDLTLDAGLDAALLQQLAQAGFRLIMHGHVHRADNTNFRYYRSTTQGGLEVITAGTFGAPTHEVVPGYPYQYQVLELTDDEIRVHTRKREDFGGGWSPDYRWQQDPNREQPALSYYVIKLK